MMLNGASGTTATGSGLAPGGASQATKDASSSPTRWMGGSPSHTAATSASANSIFAPQSASMARKLVGEDEGASGAAAAPARSAPRKLTTYSKEAAAAIATASPGRTPSRCKAAATRSISQSSSP